MRVASATLTPLMPNARQGFTAQFSDLSGPTNPTGILSPQFLALKLTLDRSDTPDNVLQALYDWLSQKGIKPSAVDRILDLDSADAAYDALVGLIGGKLNSRALPAVAQQTLRRAVQKIAEINVAKGEQEIAQSQQRLDTIRNRFKAESAGQIVKRLLT